MAEQQPSGQNFTSPRSRLPIQPQPAPPIRSNRALIASTNRPETFTHPMFPDIGIHISQSSIISRPPPPYTASSFNVTHAANNNNAPTVSNAYSSRDIRPQINIRPDNPHMVQRMNYPQLFDANVQNAPPSLTRDEIIMFQQMRYQEEYFQRNHPSLVQRVPSTSAAMSNHQHEPQPQESCARQQQNYSNSSYVQHVPTTDAAMSNHQQEQQPQEACAPQTSDVGRGRGGRRGGRGGGVRRGGRGAGGGGRGGCGEGAQKRNTQPQEPVFHVENPPNLTRDQVLNVNAPEPLQIPPPEMTLTQFLKNKLLEEVKTSNRVRRFSIDTNAAQNENGAPTISSRVSVMNSSLLHLLNRPPIQPNVRNMAPTSDNSTIPSQTNSMPRFFDSSPPQRDGYQRMEYSADSCIRNMNQKQDNSQSSPDPQMVRFLADSNDVNLYRRNVAQRTEPSNDSNPKNTTGTSSLGNISQRREPTIEYIMRKNYENTPRTSPLESMTHNENTTTQNAYPVISNVESLSHQHSVEIAVDPPDSKPRIQRRESVIPSREEIQSTQTDTTSAQKRHSINIDRENYALDTSERSSYFNVYLESLKNHGIVRRDSLNCDSAVIEEAQEMNNNQAKSVDKNLIGASKPPPAIESEVIERSMPNIDFVQDESSPNPETNEQAEIGNEIICEETVTISSVEENKSVPASTKQSEKVMSSSASSEQPLKEISFVSRGTSTDDFDLYMKQNRINTIVNSLSKVAEKNSSNNSSTVDGVSAEFEDQNETSDTDSINSREPKRKIIRKPCKNSAQSSENYKGPYCQMNANKEMSKADHKTSKDQTCKGQHGSEQVRGIIRIFLFKRSEVDYDNQDIFKTINRDLEKQIEIGEESKFVAKMMTFEGLKSEYSCPIGMFIYICSVCLKFATCNVTEMIEHYEGHICDDCIRTDVNYTPDTYFTGKSFRRKRLKMAHSETQYQLELMDTATQYELKESKNDAKTKLEYVDDAKKLSDLLDFSLKKDVSVQWEERDNVEKSNNAVTQSDLSSDQNSNDGLTTEYEIVPSTNNPTTDKITVKLMKSCDKTRRKTSIESDNSKHSKSSRKHHKYDHKSSSNKPSKHEKRTHSSNKSKTTKRKESSERGKEKESHRGTTKEKKSSGTSKEKESSKSKHSGHKRKSDQAVDSPKKRRRLSESSTQSSYKSTSDVKKKTPIKKKSVLNIKQPDSDYKTNNSKVRLSNMFADVDLEELIESSKVVKSFRNKKFNKPAPQILGIKSPMSKNRDCYKCAKCAITYPVLYEYRAHMIDMHSYPSVTKITGGKDSEKKPRFECNKCGQQHDSMRLMNLHKLCYHRKKLVVDPTTITSDSGSAPSV